MTLKQRASKAVLPHLSRQEISDLALGIAAGRVCCATDVPEDLLPVVFIPLSVGGIPDDYDLDAVGNVVDRS